MALQITKVNCPADKVAIKCPYSMVPTDITVHNTANDASAMAEVSYMLRNTSQVSFHYAVDDYRAVQGIDLNRNAWHSGDGGNGHGNRKTIAIEICYSKSGGPRFDAAENNAAILVAMLMRQYNFTMSNVHKHQDWNGKYCPHRTLDLGWNRFLQKVQDAYKELYVPAPSHATTVDISVGDTVTLSENATVYQGASKGVNIPSWAKGCKYTVQAVGEGTVLLKELVSWVLASECVVGGHKEIKEGGKVLLSTNATVYQGASKGVKIPRSVKGKTYTVQKVSGGNVLLKEITSWVLKSECTAV